MTDVYFFISRVIPQNFFLLSFIISMLVLVYFLVLYFKNGKKDLSNIWAYIFGTILVLIFELTEGMLRIRNFGADYTPLMSIVQGFFEGGVPTSLIYYFTSKVLNKKYKGLLFAIGILVIVGILLLISKTFITPGSYYTSYRAISHPGLITFFCSLYVIIILLFWVFPPKFNKMGTELSRVKKSIITYYLISLLICIIMIVLWVLTGNRAIYYGPIGGPYTPADPVVSFLWFLYDVSFEAPSLFIGPWAIGVRLGLINIDTN
ncbi:MAG: hypothetical protein ACTSPY_05930 [Candidatus Helarchaeota archaeon]